MASGVTLIHDGASTYFPIYGLDANTSCEEVWVCVVIPDSLGLMQKLKVLADFTSAACFRRAPIQIPSLSDRDGERIAVIDLREPVQAEASASWRGLFFQGSCMGAQTSYTLIKTFLQPDYRGEWIDAVEFYYEGAPIGYNWDHVILGGTIRRGQTDRE